MVCESVHAAADMFAGPAVGSVVGIGSTAGAIGGMLIAN
jgi:hypothetical protein